MMYLICLIVKLLKSLGIEHAHKEIQAVVVAVRDDTEDGLLALSQLAQFKGICIGDVLDFRQGERCQTDGSTDEDGFCSLARNELSRTF